MKSKGCHRLSIVFATALLAVLYLGTIEYPFSEQNDMVELRAGFSFRVVSDFVDIKDDYTPLARPEAVNAATKTINISMTNYIKMAQEKAALEAAKKEAKEAEAKAREAEKKAAEQAKAAELKAQAAELARQTLADSLNGPFDGFATEMLRQINEYRTANGVAELKLSSICVQAANVRVVEQATSFSHTRPNGTRFLTVYGDIGYGNIFEIKGENLQKHSDASYDIDTASLVTEAIDNFKLSESHNALMLSSNYEYVGFAVYFPGDGLIFIAQEFGNP